MIFPLTINYNEQACCTCVLYLRQIVKQSLFRFGTKSLAFHLKACEKKWENEESLKPPKQRRPCPQPPKEFQQMLSKDRITKEDINKFNTQSFDTFVEDALV